MNLRYSIFIAAILISVIIIILVVVFLAKKRSNKQKSQMLHLAKDLNLPVYEAGPLKSNRVLNRWLDRPLTIEGNYRGRALKIFLFAQSSKNNSRIYSAIRIFGSNPYGLHFTIVPRNWTQSIWQLTSTKRITFGNPIFDSQFIVKSNQPELMQKILSSSFREEFKALREEHAFRGSLEYCNDSLFYSELHPIETEYKRKRFEALADLMSFLYDEIDIHSKRT